MTAPKTPAFLSEPQRLDTPHAGTVLLHARYDIAHFDPVLFAHHHITLPDRLAVSVPKRQADFLAGRMMLSHAFAALDLPVQSVPSGRDRAPLWPEGVTGSISHTRTACACILSTNTNLRLGVDIERALSPQSGEAVHRHALTSSERTLIADQPALAGLIFSAKETLFKALYPTVQSFFGFESAEVRALPEDGSLQLHLTKTLHPDLPEGMELDVAYSALPDHVLTWLACPMGPMLTNGASL